MKIRTLLHSLILTLATGLGLIACGGGSDGDGDSMIPVSADTATPATGGSAATPVAGNDAATTASGTIPSGTALGASANCENSWKQYVALHPIGLTLAYKTTTTTTGSTGTAILSSQANSEEIIKESNDAHVLSSRTSLVEGLAQPLTSQADVTKVQFMDGCSRVGSLATGIPADVSVQILEKSIQAISVPAGAYNTDYVRGTANLVTGSTVFQSWSLQDGSAILVK
ncbi:MAG: hypothetical protein EOP06_24705, partial [Proteobacteria bacterium]